MVFVGEGGGGQATGWPCLSGPCNGVTAELNVQSEHSKGHHLRSHFFYSTVSKVAANISSTFWVALFRMLAPADGPQIYLSLIELGPHGMACLLISKQKRRGKKGKDEKGEMKRIHKDINIFTLSPSHFKFSPSPSVSGLSPSVCVFTCTK